MCKYRALGLMLAAMALPTWADEGRIPVYESPMVISESGHYVLTRNLPPPPSFVPTITINAPFVELDLNGFTIDNTGTDYGVFIQSTTKATIRNGTISGSRAISTPFAPDPIEMIVIKDIVMQMVTGQYGIHLTDVRTVVLQRNRISGPTNFAILIDGALGTSGVIEDNVIRDSVGGIVVETGTSLTIRRNHIKNLTSTGLGEGLRTVDSSALLIEGNTIEAVAGRGIRLANTVGSIVRKNTIVGAALSGILLDSFSSDNRILSNVVTESDNGILISGDRNLVEDNLLNSNAGCGLWFPGGTTANVYRGNVARGSGTCIATCSGGSPTTDFCDRGVGNTDGGGNQMP